MWHINAQEKLLQLLSISPLHTVSNSTNIWSLTYDASRYYVYPEIQEEHPICEKLDSFKTFTSYKSFTDVVMATERLNSNEWIEMELNKINYKNVSHAVILDEMVYPVSKSILLGTFALIFVRSVFRWLFNSTLLRIILKIQ